MVPVDPPQRTLSQARELISSPAAPVSVTVPVPATTCVGLPATIDQAAPLGPPLSRSVPERGRLELSHSSIVAAIGKIGESGQRTVYVSADAAGKLSVPADAVMVGVFDACVIPGQ